MDDTIRSLAQHRPASHSVADLRRALAWVIQQQHLSSRVRHEVRTRMDNSDRRYMDIWMPDGDRVQIPDQADGHRV